MQYYALSVRVLLVTLCTPIFGHYSEFTTCDIATIFFQMEQITFSMMMSSHSMDLIWLETMSVCWCMSMCLMIIWWREMSFLMSRYLLAFHQHPVFTSLTMTVRYFMFNSMLEIVGSCICTFRFEGWFYSIDLHGGRVCWRGRS